jgi:hypothetical protein
LIFSQEFGPFADSGKYAQFSPRHIAGGFCPLRKPQILFRPVRATSAFRPPPPFAGGALEMLGHAIEYLADEYASDGADKGPLGNADPRIAAIQILKGLNRAIYYSSTEVQPAFGRVKRWLLGARIAG